MKKIYFVIVIAAVVGLAATTRHVSVREGFINGSPEIKSISAMTFGPDGILFIGDAKSATVFAIDTKDAEKTEKAAAVDVKKIDQKIAASLGTTADRINITDLAVNPVSKKVYCSVEVVDGTPVLLKIDGDKITSISFKDISYSSTALANAPAEDAKDQRGRPLRISSISDIGFFDGHV